jgi:hypothetical protein
MKVLLENWKSFTDTLKESSLSRVHSHIKNHDCIIISAYRSDPFDRVKCTDNALSTESFATEPETGRPRSKKEINRMRSAELKAILLDEGYQVTEVLGSYIENFQTPQQVEVKERSLFVVNSSEQVDFVSRLTKLGEAYCQDSVLFIPKGGKDSFLIGTNNSSFPGLGNTISVGDFKGGEEAEFMTRVNDRPFTFKEGEQELQLESFNSLSRLEKMAVRSMAKNARKLLK